MSIMTIDVTDWAWSKITVSPTIATPESLQQIVCHGR
jgi:hypothetical protein